MQLTEINISYKFISSQISDPNAALVVGYFSNQYYCRQTIAKAGFWTATLQNNALTFYCHSTSELRDVLQDYQNIKACN